MGRPRSLGGRTGREREVNVAPWFLPCKNCCDDCGGCGNTGNADQDPKRLSQIDDVEEPAEKDAKDDESGDHDAERAGQCVNDALQKALNWGELNTLGESRFSDQQEQRQGCDE